MLQREGGKQLDAGSGPPSPGSSGPGGAVWGIVPIADKPTRTDELGEIAASILGRICVNVCALPLSLRAVFIAETDD